MADPFEPYEASSYEDLIRKLREQASLWARYASTIPEAEGEVDLTKFPDFFIGQLGFLRTFLEETYVSNRLELSGVARQVDETEKMLRENIDRDVVRMKKFIDSFIGRANG